MNKLCLLLLLVFGLYQIFPLNARTIIYVPEDYTEIQAAIAAAEGGDQVIVSPGTYAENVDFYGKAITVASLYYTTQDTSYISQTVIDAGNYDSVVKFINSEDSLSVLSGFTLINGVAQTGGGIICDGSSPHIDHIVIRDCTAHSFSGGGIYCDNGSSPEFDYVIVTNNWATNWGGGIYSINASGFSMSNSLINNNYCGMYGGGLYNYNSSIHLEDVVISNNISDFSAGGAFIGEAQMSTLLNVTIDNNTATWAHANGGGIYIGFSANVTLTDCIISNNTANNGGGILTYNHSITTLNNVQIFQNTAYEEGGGIKCWVSTIHLSNSEITRNRADFGGGISFNYSEYSQLENVRITDNFAVTRGGGIYFNDSSEDQLANVTVTANSSARGGGIYFRDSSPYFYPDNLCNIYLNNSTLRSGGCDLFSLSSVTVSVDTFSVLNPTNYYANRLSNFNLSIQNYIIEQYSSDLYVSPEGSDLNNGLTPEEPMQTINQACQSLLPSAADPLTIHLAAGTYDLITTGESFPILLPEHSRLLGESQESVILNANESNNVMAFNYVTDCQVKNLTITGGLSDLGGGLFIDYSQVLFQNITITENAATDIGGGVLCYIDAEPRFENVLIYNNTSENIGGGIVCHQDSYPQMINCTIVNNTAAEGGGIYCLYEGAPTLVNCIVWNNSPYQVYFQLHDFWEDNAIYAAYSDIEGGEDEIVTNDCGLVYWLEGNIDENPLFTDPNDDFTLTENSPCIDAGASYYMYDDELLVDLAPNQYSGRRPDMGFWEYIQVAEDENIIENEKLKIENYPNPFNPHTKIFYTTKDESQLTEISIYNLKGQKVKTLLKDKISEGEHSVVWDGKDESGNQCASGIFFCRFSNGADIVVNKITLLK